MPLFCCFFRVPPVFLFFFTLFVGLVVLSRNTSTKRGGKTLALTNTQKIPMPIERCKTPSSRKRAKKNDLGKALFAECVSGVFFSASALVVAVVNSKVRLCFYSIFRFG